LPTDKRVAPVVRWQAAEPGGLGMWARLADGNTILQACMKTGIESEIVAWSADEKKARYRTPQQTHSAASPALSPGRKYLLIPEDSRIRIVESVTGRIAAVLPAARSSAVAVSDDGRKAAVLSENTVSVWDLTKVDAQPEVYPAKSIGTAFHTTIDWAGPERLVATADDGNLVLFSLPHKLAVWSYEFRDHVRLEPNWRSWRAREIALEHLVYAVTDDREMAVGAARLPGPKVEEAVAALDPDALLIVKPGTAIRLDVRTGEHDARVRAALEGKIKANGWKLDAAASTVLIAEMTRGNTQQVTYRLDDGSEQTVAVTPAFSTVRIEVAGKSVWQSGTRSGAVIPPIIMLRKGQTAQSEIDRWQKPNVEFFERLDIPDRILDPAKRNGLGTTKVTTRGLVAQ
jgi:hypothetical protein